MNSQEVQLSPGQAEALERIARAETDLDAAFAALFEDYLRAPYAIELREGERATVSKMVSIWMSRRRRKHPP